MNSTQFTGNLGKDAEIKQTKNGDVANFSIFVKEYKKGDPNAGFWLNITHFKPNDFLKDVLKKGAAVGVSGRLDISKWEDKYYTKVISNSIDVFPRSGESSNNAPATAQAAEPDGDDLPF